MVISPYGVWVSQILQTTFLPLLQTSWYLLLPSLPIHQTKKILMSLKPSKNVPFRKKTPYVRRKAKSARGPGIDVKIRKARLGDLGQYLCPMPWVPGSQFFELQLGATPKAVTIGGGPPPTPYTLTYSYNANAPTEGDGAEHREGVYVLGLQRKLRIAIGQKLTAYALANNHIPNNSICRIIILQINDESGSVPANGFTLGDFVAVGNPATIEIDEYIRKDNRAAAKSHNYTVLCDQIYNFKTNTDQVYSNVQDVTLQTITNPAPTTGVYLPTVAIPDPAGPPGRTSGINVLEHIRTAPAIYNNGQDLPPNKLFEFKMKPGQLRFDLNGADTITYGPKQRIIYQVFTDQLDPHAAVWWQGIQTLKWRDPG